MPKDIYQIMDKSYLMELKLSELKTENQKEVFFRYLSIAEHYISTENEKEAEKILKNLGYNKKTIKSRGYDNIYKKSKEVLQKIFLSSSFRGLFILFIKSSCKKCALLFFCEVTYRRFNFIS